MTRAASRGKPFWHAEAEGGPLWLQPQVIGKPRDEGRIASPEDMRLWHLTSFAAGATGLLYPRWRPLLDGPLFGAFGPYGMDGGRTPRSEMAGAIARWANAPEQAELWRRGPSAARSGSWWCPRPSSTRYALRQPRRLCAAMEGAYRGFFEANIQADWVHIDDIAAMTCSICPSR